MSCHVRLRRTSVGLLAQDVMSCHVRLGTIVVLLVQDVMSC